MLDFNTYLENLDQKTITLYFLGFCFLFICLNNFFSLSSQTFYAMTITFIILFAVYRYKFFNLTNNLNEIQYNNKILRIDHFPNVMNEINLVQLFEKLKKYGKYNKYDFIDAIKETENMLINYKKLLKPCINYKQIIELAEEQRDSALNHLQVISHSIQPNEIILDEDMIYSTDNTQFHSLITDLEELLNNYIFDMYRLARSYFDKDITVYSYPVQYDNTAPVPRDPTRMISNFDLYHGTVRP